MPSSEHLLVWVHISDLHFGHGHAAHRFDQQSVTAALVADAEQKQRRLGAPDLVLLTGDIAFSADGREQYAQAGAWLDRLLKALGLPAQQVLMVPGNHDVDRKRAASAVAAPLHHSLRQDPARLDELLTDPEQLAALWPKLAAYASFASAYGAPPLSPHSPFFCRPLALPGGRPALVVGLNTALLSCDGDDGPDNLALGRGQIYRAIESQPEGALLLVLMHHPPSWLRDGKELLAQLRPRPHLLLSGHLHEQTAALSLPLGRGGAILHLQAGAGHGEAGASTPHTYAWGRLLPGGIEYHARTFDPELRAFVAAPLRDDDEFRRSDHVFVPRGKLPRPLSRWLAGAAGRPVITPSPDVTPAPLDNPFKKSGTLPSRQRSYVRRACDDQLLQALTLHGLVGVHGEFGIGKSSLVVRALEQIKDQYTTCYIDLQGYRTDHEGIFHGSFFAELQHKLGAAALDWAALKRVLGERRMVLCLDDFGCLNTPPVTRSFLAALHHFVHSHNDAGGHVRLWVCLPETVPNYYQSLTGLNPKYLRDWHHVAVEPLDDVGVDHLLSLLPERAQLLVQAHLQEVMRLSARRPNALQCMCYELFAAAAQGAPPERLTAVMLDRSSYQ